MTDKTTPAASGAAPAESFEKWLNECDDPKFPTVPRRGRFFAMRIEDFRTGWFAALASRASAEGKSK